MLILLDVADEEEFDWVFWKPWAGLFMDLYISLKPMGPYVEEWNGVEIWGK